MLTKETIIEQKAEFNTDLYRNIIIIKNFEDFSRIEKSWQNLADKQFKKSIHYNFVWYKTNWEWFEKQGVPNIICIYKNEQLIGILPLVVYSKRGKNILKFLATPFYPFNDIIVDPIHTDYVINKFSELLNNWNNYWYKVELENLSNSSLLYNYLHYALPNEVQFNYKIYQSKQLLYYLPLTKLGVTWSKYLEKHSITTRLSHSKIEKKFHDLSQSLEHTYLSKQNHQTYNQQFCILVNQLTQHLKLPTHEKNTLINYYAKKLSYYNPGQHWFMITDWIYDSNNHAQLMSLHDHQNAYHLNTSFSKGLGHNQKRYFFSLLIKSYISNNIEKLYILGKMQRWQKNWVTQKEPLYNIQIFNKSQK